MGVGIGVGVLVGVEVGGGVGVGEGVGVGVGVDMIPLQPNKANPISAKKPIRNKSLFLSNVIPPAPFFILHSLSLVLWSFCEPPVPPLLHSHTINPTMTEAPPKEAKPTHRNM